MDKLVVHGGSVIKGAINISGSKNASLPILAAAILTGEDCIIRRVPDVSDTNYMIQILSALGADVERSSGTVRITCADISDEAPYELVRRMRASICVMGPLLARKGRAVVSLPGGCVIGDRPVDLHLKGMQALGAKIEFEGGNIYWSPGTGAWSVENGPLFDGWKSVGYEGGRLGFPISDKFDIPGGVQQNFQFGYITVIGDKTEVH